MFSARLAVQWEGMCFRYDHPHIIAGQGTLGLEIADQAGDLDAVVVPVGGGGLIAGVALALKTLYPKITVIVSTTSIINALYYTNNYYIMYMNNLFSVSVPSMKYEVLKAVKMKREVLWDNIKVIPQQA